MKYSIENLVRSVAVVVVGLPLTAAFGGALNTITELASNSASTAVVEEFKADLAVPCLKYVMSKNDSKLEREAKNLIDEVLGGEVNHRTACGYVLD